MADLSEANLDAVARGAAWNPKPLRKDDRPFDYPVERLPGVIGEAVREVADCMQAPVALVAACALSAVSAAVQSQFSVRRNRILQGPASLYFLTVADSGERKSTVDSLFMKPLKDWEAQQRQREKELEEEYRAELAAWERADSADRGDPPDKPEPSAKMLRGDDTSEALISHLSKYPVAAVISAEAGVIFGSHSMKTESVKRNLGLLNQLWDGGPVNEGRVTRGETYIESVRVTMGLMVQSTVLESFFQKTEGLARGIGFNARFLFSQPESTQGMRFYKEPGAMPALGAFQRQVTLLLRLQAAKDDLGRLTSHDVKFDAEAQDAWIRFHDEVEEFLGGDREYSTIKDVASKAAENAARLACCLHVFANYGGALGDIERSTTDAACSLMRWYLDEAVRFGRKAEMTEELRNAELLEAWLVEKHKEAIRQKSETPITVNTIRQKGPNSLRGGRRIDDALHLLQDHGRVRVAQAIGSKTRFVTVAPTVIMEWS
ncbi:MAG: YfjI family protein [Croceibacterium sp.]